MRRSAGEMSGLIVAFVVGGAAVTFGIVIMGSFLHLPHAAIWIAGAIGLAAISYPMVRSTQSASSSANPQQPAPSSADQVREDRHV